MHCTCRWTVQEIRRHKGTRDEVVLVDNDGRIIVARAGDHIALHIDVDITPASRA